MSEQHVECSKTDESCAVLVRQCLITNAIEPQVFKSVELARRYCYIRWGLQDSDWEAFLMRSDETSKIKYNDKPVSFCGWQAYITESDRLELHLEEPIVEIAE